MDLVVETKQVLMEAFIVEATSSFERALGTKLGGAYTRNRERVGGSIGTSTVGETEGGGAAISADTAAIGSSNDTLFQSGAVGAATSGIGILRRTGSAVLKVQLDDPNLTGRKRENRQKELDALQKLYSEE